MAENKPNLRRSSKESHQVNLPKGMSREMADYLASVVRFELHDIKSSVKSIQQDIAEIKHSLTDCSERVEQIQQTFLPSLSKRITDISVALAERVLDMDVHSRKWSLIINGVKGVAGENETVTREKCIKLATDMGVTNAGNIHFSACHRLNHAKADAGIIARFSDLGDRDELLAKAKNLANSLNKNVNISPDLPPVLRKLKNELLDKRREMEPNMKRNTRVKHIAQWPYVKLVYKDNSHPPLSPSFTKEQILQDILGFAPGISFNFV